MKSFLRFFFLAFILADAAAVFVWWTHPKGARKMGYSGEIPFELPFKLPYDVVVKKKGPAPLPESVTAPVAEQVAAPAAPTRPSLQRPVQSEPEAPAEKPKPKPKPRVKSEEELELEGIAAEVGVSVPGVEATELEEEESSGLLDQDFDKYEKKRR